MRRRTKFLLAGLLATGPAAFGADPVTYSVHFAKTGDPTLDALLRQSSALVALQKKLPAAPFALIGRARADQNQFLIVLHSLGYDAGSVAVTIGGATLNDPALLDSLTQAPAARRVTVLVTPHPGPVFRLGRVDVTGLPAGFSRPAMVRPGERALAAGIIAASATLRTGLQNAGYAFATVSAPQASAEPARNVLDVTYTVIPGPRVTIGAIAFAGLHRTDANFLRHHIALHPGQRYSNTSIDTARDALLGLGIFAAVTPVPGPAAGAGNTVPITFRVTMQKRHAVTISGLYATDQGFTLSTSWEDRNLFAHAETLTFTAAANGLAGTGTTAPGYDLKGVFTKPDFCAGGQSLNMSLEGVRESLTAYSRSAALAGVALVRPLTPQLGSSAGPAFVAESVLQEDVRRHYVLLQFPVSFTYNTADSLLEPTKGMNASLSVTPTQPVLGGHQPFLIAQASAATYLPVADDARGIIALRAQLGSILGATQFAVPPDQRFYAGGSGTVRGYTYQTIGPHFADDNPQGGLAIDTASVELRQHVFKTFGIVPFVDIGQVSAGSAPFTGRLRVGAGLGARYYTGIGPIRLDLAFPLTRVAGSGGFALYVGLGEAF